MLPHNDSVRSEGFPNQTHHEQRNGTQEELPHLQPNFGPRSNQVYPPNCKSSFFFDISTTHPRIQSKQITLTKFHSVPLTVAEQPQQDPANDLGGECVAHVE
jgi:hypothetical protein